MAVSYLRARAVAAGFSVVPLVCVSEQRLRTRMRTTLSNSLLEAFELWDGPPMSSGPRGKSGLSGQHMCGAGVTCLEVSINTPGHDCSHPSFHPKQMSCRASPRKVGCRSRQALVSLSESPAGPPSSERPVPGDAGQLQGWGLKGTPLINPE